MAFRKNPKTFMKKTCFFRSINIRNEEIHNVCILALLRETEIWGKGTIMPCGSNSLIVHIKNTTFTETLKKMLKQDLIPEIMN